MAPQMHQSREEQLQSCWTMQHEPALSQGSMAVHAHITDTPRCHLQQEGQAGWYSHSLCCVTWEQQLLLGCTLDTGCALLHMRAALRQEGGQGSPHPAEEDDAALFRLQQQWIFHEQRTLNMAGQF